MLYNHRLKLYPDGTSQHTIYFRPLERENPQPNLPFKPKKKDTDYNDNKEVDHQKRARIEVFDLCRCNEFDYFITLTFDPDRINSFHYDSCTLRIKDFLQWLSRNNCSYIIVPEQHQSGRWHFHGLVKGNLKLEQAYNPHTGLPIDGIYNIVNYKHGFTTASKIRDHVKVSSYICKYLTKDMQVPKGRKRYWCSAGLERPLIGFEYKEDIQDLMDIAIQADYTKIIQSKYIEGRIYEIHGKNRTSEKD